MPEKYKLNPTEEKIITNLSAAKSQAERDLTNAFAVLLAAHGFEEGDLVKGPEGLFIQERTKENQNV